MIHHNKSIAKSSFTKCKGQLYQLRGHTMGIWNIIGKCLPNNTPDQGLGCLENILNSSNPQFQSDESYEELSYNSFNGIWGIRTFWKNWAQKYLS